MRTANFKYYQKAILYYLGVMSIMVLVAFGTYKVIYIYHRWKCASSPQPYLHIEYLTNKNRDIFVKHVYSDKYDCVAVAKTFEALRTAQWNGTTLEGSDGIVVTDSISNDVNTPATYIRFSDRTLKCKYCAKYLDVSCGYEIFTPLYFDTLIYDWEELFF